MKILLEVPDNEAVFGIKVLKSLSFVKKIKPMNAAKDLLIEELKEAVTEINLIKSGKKKARNAEDFLNEL
jgi:hypothetical protein